MQSGSVVEATSSRLVPEQLLYDDLVGLSGCGDAEDSLDCLRHAPYESIITSFNGSQYGIGSMAAAFSPLMGVNQIPGFVQNWTHLRDVLTDEHMYPSKVMDRLMSFYPPLTAGSDDNLDPPIKGLSISSRAELERIEQLMGDLAVNAGTRLMCETYAALSVCYSFRFDAMVSSVFDPRLGVRHGDEIGPVFQNFDGIGLDVNPFEGKGDGLRDMSRLIGIMWAGFITELDPNAGLSRDDIILVVLFEWPI
ncbi:Alpha/Beta hydrolase protein [Xylaria longipes]|nr:Alpha/Beta hydrolase protein [Xylaria longipes]